MSEPLTTTPRHGNYIAGEWVEATNGKTIEVFNPSTGELLAHVPDSTVEDTRHAIAAARTAFDSGAWSELSPKERSRIMLSMVDKLTAHGDELAELESANAGMTLRATSAVFIGYCINHWEHFAEQAARSPHEPLPPVEFPTHAYNFVRREPIGVCAGIVPWNFPLVMAVWKLAPALAMGNTIVLKPASNTPLTALRVAQLIDETDLPKGVVNVITGSGATVGEELAAHPDVDKVSFTGSTEVGRRVMRLASDTVKRCTLELGGKSPTIVLDDADIDSAVDGALWATFFHQGQVCESGTRLFLPESIHDAFVDALVMRAEQIKVGHALNFETDMGPLISASQLQNTERYVDIGRAEGARLVTGGKRPKDVPSGGHYFEPTIFTGVENSMRIAREEIFGPVLSVLKYKTVDDVVRLANDSIYGLAAGVWSTDHDRALDVAKRVRVGTVWINDHHLINCVAPFGGYKQSGIGRELGTYGLDEYTEVKHVHVDLTKDPDRKLFSVLLSTERN